MRYASWAKVDLETRRKISRQVSVFCKIDRQLYRYVEKVASKRYCQWNHQLHVHYKDFRHLGHLGTPRELFNHEEDWKKLCEHFESEEFKRKSEANTSNRGEKMHNHCSGSMSFKERAEAALASEKHPVSYIVVMEYAYPHAHEKIAAVKRVADKHILEDVQKQFPDTPRDQLPISNVQVADIESQGLIFGEALKPKNKHHLMGLGKAGYEVYTRVVGPCAQATNEAALLAVQAVQDVVEKAAEEVQRAREEAENAKAEALKMQELNHHIWEESSQMKVAIGDM